MSNTVVAAIPNSPSPIYTLGDLVAALDRAGVKLEKPGVPYGLPSTSAAIGAISEATDAIEDHKWTVLHSGATDMLLAGPTSNIPIPDMVEALVGVRADKASEVEPDRRARYAGGFTCLGCGHFNLLRSSHEVPSSERWYCVAAGTDVGVFQGSTVAGSYTRNVKGSAMEGFNTREEAQAAFDKAKAAGAVKKIVVGETQTIG